MTSYAGDKINMRPYALIFYHQGDEDAQRGTSKKHSLFAVLFS
jgi:hypothetical protein